MLDQKAVADEVSEGPEAPAVEQRSAHGAIGSAIEVVDAHRRAFPSPPAPPVAWQERGRCRHNLCLPQSPAGVTAVTVGQGPSGQKTSSFSANRSRL
jgi:hypothetical protein